jgi:hypothetical protein
VEFIMWSRWLANVGGAFLPSWQERD